MQLHFDTIYHELGGLASVIICRIKIGAICRKCCIAERQQGHNTIKIISFICLPIEWGPRNKN